MPDDLSAPPVRAGGDLPARAARLLDLAAGGLLVVLPLLAGLSGAGSAVCLLLGPAVVLRRRLPAVAVALALVSAAVQAVWWPSTPAPLAYGLLAHGLGADHRAGWRRLGLVLSAAAAVLAGAAGAAHAPSSDLTDRFTEGMIVAAMATLVAGGGWLLGRQRWQRQVTLEAQVAQRLALAEQRRLSERVEQERLRARIATDMHDVVAHSLAVVAAQAAGARYALPGEPERAQEALDVIGETARHAIGDLRRLLAQLRTGQEEPVDGVAGSAVEQERVLARMRASGMDLRLHQQGEPPDSPWLRLTVQRLLAEALTNALKHGDLARPVQVRLDWRDGCRLRVENEIGDGAADGTGHGLTGMAERAAASGGRLAAGRRGSVWVLEASLPPTEDGR